MNWVMAQIFILMFMLIFFINGNLYVALFMLIFLEIRAAEHFIIKY